MNNRQDASSRIGRQTIEDFGEQWTEFSDTSGFFGSKELLADFISPFDIRNFEGRRVADIGAGTGRHVDGILEAGAREVIAVEPSQAIDVIRRRLSKDLGGRVIPMQITGDQLPPTGDIDYVISVGVIHHIPNPAPVVKAAYNALRPGGQFVVWLYGKEGNRLYLALVMPIRWFSKSLPMPALKVLSRLLDIPLAAYIFVCKKVHWRFLPLRDYMVAILGRLPADRRRVVIYDQLNPHYAKYYTGAEARALMSCAPFDVEVHHRRGYSWVVIGTKPAHNPRPA
jgi:SAM-dependent methyltransferase